MAARLVLERGGGRGREGLRLKGLCTKDGPKKLFLFTKCDFPTEETYVRSAGEGGSSIFHASLVAMLLDAHGNSKTTVNVCSQSAFRWPLPTRETGKGWS